MCPSSDKPFSNKSTQVQCLVRTDMQFMDCLVSYLESLANLTHIRFLLPDLPSMTVKVNLSNDLGDSIDIKAGRVRVSPKGELY
jgi:hypothetical protein